AEQREALPVLAGAVAGLGRRGEDDRLCRGADRVELTVARHDEGRLGRALDEGAGLDGERPRHEDEVGEAVDVVARPGRVGRDGLRDVDDGARAVAEADRADAGVAAARAATDAAADAAARAAVVVTTGDAEAGERQYQGHKQSALQHSQYSLLFAVSLNMRGRARPRRSRRCE